MPATWPPQLPTEPLASSWKPKPDPRGRIASQVDEGPSKARRRGALRTKPLDPTYVIPRADFALFETFFEDTLGEGVLPFDWPDPVAAVTRRVRFRPSEQEPYAAELERGGKNYLVTIKIEVLP